MSQSHPNELLARVLGEPYHDLPKDLYIPPDALRVLLIAFEGPLDLLLYLIRKHHFDVLNIPVSEITEQYLAYMKLMEQLDIGLAAEYLLMAATLGEIKARLLFPKTQSALDDENIDDPRLDLIEQLKTYAQIKTAAQHLAQSPRIGERIHLSGQTIELNEKNIPPVADPKRLHQCLESLAKQQFFRQAHTVETDAWVLANYLINMKEKLSMRPDWQNLDSFYPPEQGKAGLVLNLMAMLELDREQILEWYQEEHFAPVFIKNRKNKH